MSSDGIDYQKFVEDALRDAVRRLLAEVAEHGLPGEHYFYIGFQTAHPSVMMPSLLRDLYPDEMTIVLQHQYWNLDVQPDHFSVELSFSASRHRLAIPFAALTTFADPSVDFLWRFQPRQPAREDAGAGDDQAGVKGLAPAGPAAVPSRPARPAATAAASPRAISPAPVRGAAASPVPSPAPAAPPPGESSSGPAAAPPPVKDRPRGQPGEIIRFDPSRRRSD